MHRVLFSPQRVRDLTITVDDPREVHHLAHVLRLGVGDRVLCFDGQGSEYLGIIAQVKDGALSVRIERRIDATSDDLQVWLAPALLKGDRFEWVIQKATELGVRRVMPLLTARTIVRLSSSGGQAKHARWQRIAREAAKQCGNPVIPTIEPVQRFESFLPVMKSAKLALLPTLAVTAVPLREVIREPEIPQPIVILIGPEGDFSREEVVLAEAHGARPVSLGSLVLRAETASVAVLAMLRYAFGRV